MFTLQELNVNVVLIGRGSCPEIVMAETIAKQMCAESKQSSVGSDQNFNSTSGLDSEIYLPAVAFPSAASATNIVSNYGKQIANTVKLRQKEKNRKKLASYINVKNHIFFAYYFSGDSSVENFLALINL